MRIFTQTPVYPNAGTESATGIKKRRMGMAEITTPLDGEDESHAAKPDAAIKSPRRDIETPEEKKARRAEALRANLRRRKDQKRARVPERLPERTPGPPESEDPQSDA